MVGGSMEQSSHRQGSKMLFLLITVIALLGIRCDSYLVDNEIENEMMGWLPFEYHQYTTALHGMHEPRKYRYHPVVNPIYTSVTYQQKEPGQDYGFVYSRIGNPTRQSLEKLLAKLDYAKYSCVFPSGMAAIFSMLKMLTPDDHIVSSEDVFDGTFKYINEHRGIEFQATFVNPSVEEYVAAIKPNTRMLWVESPSNPVLKVTDIPGLVRAVKKIRQDIIIVMDNTFMGPFFQKGLKLGADVVVYSLSKYMNGHADVLMGAAVTNHKTINDYLVNRQRFSGMLPSPFDCYQVMRGLKTHPVRMLQHWKNALRIAMWLEKNPYVELVHYPGLKSQSKLPRTMWSGMSGMVSFRLKNFNANMTRDFLGQLQYFSVAWSLGSAESLAEQPFVMLDMSFPEVVRRKLGVTPNLVRLSVGLEYYQDLIDDLDQAMKSVAPEGPPYAPNVTPDPYDVPGDYKRDRDPRDDRHGRWKPDLGRTGNWTYKRNRPRRHQMGKVRLVDPVYRRNSTEMLDDGYEDISVDPVEQFYEKHNAYPIVEFRKNRTYRIINYDWNRTYPIVDYTKSRGHYIEEDAYRPIDEDIE